MPVIYVDVKQSRRLWPLARPQRWYWVALNANNFRRLARSSETYTNYGDLLAAIEEVFGGQTVVYRREAEKGNVLVRHPEPWPGQ